TAVSPLPDSNNTVYTFSQRTSAPPNFYLTEKQVNQGASTLLADIVTCYNGNQSNCPTAAAPSLPITQTDVYTTLSPMSSSSRVSTQFDSYENVTDVKQYEFGASSPTLWRH